MSKRRKKSKIKRRKSTRKITIARKFKYFTILIFIFGFFLITYIFLFKSSYFKLKSIQTKGNYPLNTAEILKATFIKEDESIWESNLNRISDRLKKVYPEYKKVIVKRELPNILVFHFVLRKPIAQIKSGRYFLVDENNFILPKIKNVADPNLPVIRGVNSKLIGIKPGSKCDSETITNAIKLLKAVQESEIFTINDLVYVDITDFKNLFFTLENGIIVKIGDYNFKQRIKKLGYVLKEIEYENVAYIDLRFKDPVLSPR